VILVIPQRVVKFTLMHYLRVRNRFGKPKAPSLYYFAYGANLDANRFKKYRMNYEAVGVARVPDYALTFTFPCEYLGKGYADIAAEPGGTVWGFVYKLDWVSFFLLDVMEWAAFNQYRRIPVEAILQDGTRLVVEAYQARYPREGLAPSQLYLTNIVKSSVLHGFPDDYRARLEKVVPGEKFELDPSFSFLHPPKPRWGARKFRRLYLAHDRFREWVCDRLRF